MEQTNNVQKFVEKQNIKYSEVTKFHRFKAKYLSKKFFIKLVGNLFVYVLVIGISYVIVYPLLRRIGNAFKPAEEFYDSSIVYFPRNPTLENVKSAFRQIQFSTVGVTSLLLALAIGVLQTAVATFASYGFARFDFRGSKVLFFAVLLTLVVPQQTILIPIYLQFRYFDLFGLIKVITGSPVNLIDTFWPQIILSMTGLGWKNGLYIYMMRQYFKGIPRVLEEAAYIDGARSFRTFFQIMVPSAVPMMVTVFLFSFCWQWTDNFYSGTFLIKKKLLATSINSIYHIDELTQMNYQNTALLMIVLPLVLLFIVTQRFFVEGVERSGITG